MIQLVGSSITPQPSACLLSELCLKLLLKRGVEAFLQEKVQDDKDKQRLEDKMALGFDEIGGMKLASGTEDVPKTGDHRNQRLWHA